jgi:FkbM family methyltransferase
MPGDPNRGIASLSRQQRLQRRGVRIRVLTLDELARRLPGPPRLIKVDVEGHELAVLRGGSALLAERRPLLIFEYSKRLFESASAD